MKIIDHSRNSKTVALPAAMIKALNLTPKDHFDWKINNDKTITLTLRPKPKEVC